MFFALTSHTSSFTFKFKTLQKNTDMTVWNEFLKEWFYYPFFSDTINSSFTWFVWLKKTVQTDQQLFVSLYFLTNIAWKVMLVCLPGDLFCNGNRWWLTSKWSTKGTGKTLEEQARERTDPYVWVLTETSSTARHKLSQRHKNRGKIELLPWARGRGEDLTLSQ